MKYLALLLIFGFGLSGFGQTIKSLGYNTTNGQVVYSGTNPLVLPNNSIINGSMEVNVIRPIGGGGGIFINDGIFQDTSGVGGESFNWGTGDLEMGVPISFATTNIVATTRANLGLGWSALINTNAATSLLGFTTNGTVVANTGTNVLTFTNQMSINNAQNATGGSSINLQSASGKNATLLFYDSTNSETATNGNTNWAVSWWGVNLKAGSNAAPERVDYTKGAAAWAVENEYLGAADGGTRLSETYFTTIDQNGLMTRGIGLYASQTNSLLGAVDFGYPVSIVYSSNQSGFYGSSRHALNVISSDSVQLLKLQRSSTNVSDIARFDIQVGPYGAALQHSRFVTWFRNFEAGRNAYRINTNGVIYGSTDANLDASAPIHLAGNTRIDGAISFDSITNAAITRTNLGLGETNAVSFSGIYNNGNFTNINGTIYGLKTNVGPFEGIGNFFASNNTTLSNETLFRVGLAEATNKSAQFGFRVTRTNNGGEGVAVYSVFGYNALMMIGPSDRSRINYATNTNAGIEATLWTITPTNQVMTLRDTNTGATTLHQSLGFDTNVTSTAPANTTNIVKWIEVWVGTNSYRMPLYQ